MRTPSTRHYLALSLGLVACTGALGDPSVLAPTEDGPALGGGAQVGGASGQPPVKGGATGSTSALRCAAGQPIDPGPAPLRLLSRTQYLNTVRDLFGDVPELASVIGSDNQSSELGLAQGDATQVQVEQYQTAAGLISRAVVGNADKLKALAPCTGSDQRACAGDMVKTLGARAYRAPITDVADLERHLKLYDVGKATSHTHGLELLLAGMLQSPRFLYRVELGTAEKVSASAVKLSGHEVAARLSYALWNTLPDQALSELAASGKLETREQVEQQLERMLQDERGKKVVRRFLESWMHLGQLDATVKDETLFPSWSGSSLRASMRGQAQRFLDYVLEDADGTLDTLLTSPKVFVNNDLAPFYGLTGGADFSAVDVSSQPTSGLLTLPAWLAITAKPNESSPIYRGKFVRESMFCQQLPAPPPDIPKAPDVQAGVSTRERLAQHEADPSCSGCHSLMDPIGFGLESFDAVGRFRTTDGARPVDESGELKATDVNGKFTGVVELGHKLADSAQVQECVARQWFRFALGRFEQEADACSMQGLLDELDKNGRDLTTLPRAVVHSDAFLYRRPIEVSP